jgi:SAM-dependent methyltransferase
MEYLFGDTDTAASRLKVLADTFAESTSAFLWGLSIKGPALAIDLGCGPGYSTHLVANALGCELVVGLDNSERFISIARRVETKKVSFLLHDVTSLPFPVGQADILYCRMLLTHLRDPLPLMARWASQLRPEGLLLIEETEWIRTNNFVFNSYIEIVEKMLEGRSNNLYIGPLLDSLEDTEPVKRRANSVRVLSVENRRAAAMFFLNLQHWRDTPFILRNYSPEVIDKLGRSLKDIVNGPEGESEIEWGLRQVVYEKVQGI